MAIASENGRKVYFHSHKEVKVQVRRKTNNKIANIKPTTQLFKAYIIANLWQQKMLAALF